MNSFLLILLGAAISSIGEAIFRSFQRARTAMQSALYYSNEQAEAGAEPTQYLPLRVPSRQSDRFPAPTRSHDGSPDMFYISPKQRHLPAFDRRINSGE